MLARSGSLIKQDESVSLLLMESCELHYHRSRLQVAIQPAVDSIVSEESRMLATASKSCYNSKTKPLIVFLPDLLFINY